MNYQHEFRECPFCGSMNCEHAIRIVPAGTLNLVKCRNCGACGPPKLENKLDAFYSWRRRPEVDHLQRKMGHKCTDAWCDSCEKKRDELNSAMRENGHD